MYFVNKTALKLAFRVSPTCNAIFNSLFIELALSECLNVVLFYTYDMKMHVLLSLLI
jgi:hypothetical protein